MRRMMIGTLLVALVASAGESQQQDLRVTGRVTTEEGTPIVGAGVYNDFGVSVITDSAGRYVFVVQRDRLPAFSGSEVPVVHLRVRAIGFYSGSEMVRLAAGEQTVNFRLRKGELLNEQPVTDSMREAFRRAAAQGRPPETAARPLVRPQQGPSAGQLPDADPFGRYLFTPEQVMQHQDAIGLRQSQREALQSAMQGAQEQIVRMQWALAQAGEKMTQLLNATSVDEKAVLAHVDQIIGIEREIKRAQMSLLVKIKNTLTAEQQARLRAARGGE